MKNRKFLFILLIFLILIFPLEAYAEPGPFGWIKEKIIGFGQSVANLVQSTAQCLGNPVFCAISLFVHAITWLVHQVLWNFNLHVLAPLVNYASQINPFHETKGGSPAVVAWDILKNYGYILLVFSALLAAYEWLLGDDATAKRRIFIIIAVALIISFTFVLIKETFDVVKKFEDGLIGNVKEKGIGFIMAASLWQVNPFEEINEISGIEETGSTFKYLAKSIAYIFIITFDMGMTIILVVTLLLYIARYFFIIALTAVSSIAVATKVLPEFKQKALATFQSLQIFDRWLQELIKWLIVIPIFVTIVLLCNITKENILDQLKLFGAVSQFIQFVMLFFGFTACYAGAIFAAIKLGGVVAAFGASLTTGAFAKIGGLAAKGLMRSASGKIGGFLVKTGEKLQEKVGVGGMFGWRSWISQKIGGRVQEVGKRMIERRYGLEASAIKERIGAIDEQLRKETDPTKIQNLTSQLAQLVKRYQNNPYVLKSINEEIGRMSPLSFGKIARDANALQALANPEVPQETREKVIDRIEKLRKDDLKKMAGDANWLSIIKNLSPDVADALVEKIGKELKETDGLEIISKDEVRDIIPQLPENLQKTLNNVTKGFLNALLEKNLENISNAMSTWDEDVWLKLGNTEKINHLFKPRLTNEEMKTVILQTIRKSKNRGIFVTAASRENMGGLLRKTFASMSEQEINDLKNLLNPQDKASLDTIILEEREYQKQQQPQQLEIPFEEGTQAKEGPQQLSFDFGG